MEIPRNCRARGGFSEPIKFVDAILIAALTGVKNKRFAAVQHGRDHYSQLCGDFSVDRNYVSASKRRRLFRFYSGCAPLFASRICE